MAGITQDALAILLLKIGLVSGFSLIVTWVTVYARLSKGRVWQSPVGRSLMRFALLVAGLLVPFTLSLFFHLTRLDSRIVLWADVILIGAVPVEMGRRIALFIRIGPAPRGQGAAELHDVPPPAEPPAEVITDGTA